MKKFYNYVMIAIMAIAVCFTACKKDSNSSGGGNNKSLDGTWEASGGRAVIFMGNTFEYEVNGTKMYSGVFSTSGSTITFDETELGMASGNFQISGQTLTLSNHTWDNNVNGIYTKANNGGGSGSSIVINATNVIDSNSDITSVKAIMYYGYDYENEYEAASAEYKNNGFKLTLPETISDKYLNLLGDEIEGSGLNVSDRNAKVGRPSINAYNKQGGEMGYLYFYDMDKSVEMAYMYADRDVTVKGTVYGDGHYQEWDVSGKKGWNIVYFVSDYVGGYNRYLMTTKKPSGVNCECYYQRF